jgi:outer membrane protein OmpU
MNKITKIGLTALAGSLIASSVNAAEMTATAGASLTWTGGNPETTGQALTMGNSVTFSGSGDLDNGMTISVSYELDDDVMDDYSMSLGLGDSGTLSFHGSGGAGGLSAYDDVMPTAYAEVWDNTDADDNGVVGTMASTNNVVYAGSFGDVGVSAEWSKGTVGSSGSDSSVVINYSGFEGLEIGVGAGSDSEVSDQETQYIKYTMGGITVGMQKSEIDFDAAATKDEERDHVAVSFAVNENLSISYGMSDVDMGTATEEESSGVSFSYTMGSMSFGGAVNKTDNVAGASGTNDEVTELNVAFSF